MFVPSGLGTRLSSMKLLIHSRTLDGVVAGKSVADSAQILGHIATSGHHEPVRQHLGGIAVAGGAEHRSPPAAVAFRTLGELLGNRLDIGIGCGYRQPHVGEQILPVCHDDHAHAVRQADDLAVVHEHAVEPGDDIFQVVGTQPFDVIVQRFHERSVGRRPQSGNRNHVEHRVARHELTETLVVDFDRVSPDARHRLVLALVLGVEHLDRQHQGLSPTSRRGQHVDHHRLVGVSIRGPGGRLFLGSARKERDGEHE